MIPAFRIKLACIALVSIVLQGCSVDKTPDASSIANSDSHKQLFRLVPPYESHVGFINSLKESDEINVLTYQYLYNGAGVATGDIDNDGLADLFFAGNQAPCRLYKNNGRMQFTDITERAGIHTSGWCQGVTFADVNNDGFLDIYICRSSKFETPANRTNLLFINNGNGTFTEKAHAFGLDNEGYSTHASFFDYDHDGDLDMYLVNHGVDFNNNFIGFKKRNSMVDPLITHRLYRNNGNNTFSDASASAGVLCNTFGLSVTICDLNNDGWEDMYVSNDFSMPDFVYINNHNGTFTDHGQQMMKHMSYFSMGTDVADINNDLLQDVVTLDMSPEDNRRQKMLFAAQNIDRYNMMVAEGYGKQFMQNCLQINNGDGTFSDIAHMAGIAQTDWSWGPLLADFDNDGWKDLFVTNGYLRDETDLDNTVYRAEEMRKNNGIQQRDLRMVLSIPTTKLRNYMFNNHTDNTFRDSSDAWGFSEKTISNGVSYADLDNDGDLDLVISNLNDTAMVYENRCTETTGNHFLRLKLKGDVKNPFSVGALVEVTAGGVTQVQQLSPSRGYESSMDYVLVFGTGKNKSAEKITVKWNSGNSETVLRNISCDTTLIISIKDAEKKETENKNEKVTLFTEINPAAFGNFVHHENPFIDFKREPLLTHQIGRYGPGIAVGDVNGDGIDDYYVGGAEGQAGVLYVQQQNGMFKAATGEPFEADRKYEDMGALFFDADDDGDVDLYVISGGSTENVYNESYQDRLYINKGKGNFVRDLNALPVIKSSGSCVSAGDYDGDGDDDLFIGGRIAPSMYPLTIRSYLLRNDKGKFTDVTKETAPGLEYPGMVTSALWTDFNNDNKIDLLIAGEWMPVAFFENRNGKLEEIITGSGLENSKGWWNSLAGMDFDHDGDIDYVAGNYGLNSKIKTSEHRPVSILYKDFDGNGTHDAVLNYYQSDGKSYPWCSRDDFTDQMRVMRKRFLRYADYASKTVNEIFTADELKNANVLYATTFSTSYIENLGNGHFRISPLPVAAQCFPVYGMVPGDFNEDGNPDILLTGNFFSENVNIGRNDAGNGLLLFGDGKGNFKPCPVQQSGFLTPLDAKALTSIYVPAKGKMVMLITNNNAIVQAFAWNRNQKGRQQFVRAGRNDKRVFWEDAKGNKSLAEIYKGSGYLSQYSLMIPIPQGAKNVSVSDNKGILRKAELSYAR